MSSLDARITSSNFLDGRAIAPQTSGEAPLFIRGPGATILSIDQHSDYLIRCLRAGKNLKVRSSLLRELEAP